MLLHLILTAELNQEVPNGKFTTVKVKMILKQTEEICNSFSIRFVYLKKRWFKMAALSYILDI